MKKWIQVIVFLVTVAVVSPVSAQQQATLALKYPEGRLAEYKNKYRFEYYSNRAELIIMQSGSMRVIVDNEWRSYETTKQPEVLPNEEIADDIMAVRAEVDKAASAAIFLGEKQTYEQFPFTFELFNDRAFKWRVTPNSEIQKFEPDFHAYRVERQDLVTDIFQAWVPALTPILPDKPVSKGDTWTGERTYERPFISMDMMGRKSLVGIKSKYTVKSIKKKKDRLEVKIEEEREVEYKGWMAVSSASLFLHGMGSGEGEWVIDAANGIVLEHKMHMDVDQPTVIKAGQKDPLSDIHAEIKIDVERKLEDLKN